MGKQTQRNNAEQDPWFPILEKKTSRAGISGEIILHKPITLGLRSMMAWELIHQYGAVAGQRWDGDPAGKAMELQTPAELVERCFEIVDIFFNVAAGRGEVWDIRADIQDQIEHADEWIKKGPLGG